MSTYHSDAYGQIPGRCPAGRLLSSPQHPIKERIPPVFTHRLPDAQNAQIWAASHLIGIDPMRVMQNPGHC